MTLQDPHRTIQMSISPNGQWLASLGYASKLQRPEVRIWDIKTGKLKHKPAVQFSLGADDEVAVAFTPSSSAVLFNVGRTRAEMMKVDIDSGTSSTIRLTYQESATGFAIAAAADVAAVGRIDHSTTLGRPFLEIYSASAGRAKRTIPADNHVRALALSPDGQVLAGSIFGRVQVWKTADGLKIDEFADRSAHHDRIVISPNGRYIAALYRGEIDLRDLERRLSPSLQLTSQCLDIAFARNGSLAVTMPEGQMKFFDAETGREQLLGAGAP
jgi:WD40 repeat protein